MSIVRLSREMKDIVDFVDEVFESPKEALSVLKAWATMKNPDVRPDTVADIANLLRKHNVDRVPIAADIISVLHQNGINTLPQATNAAFYWQLMNSYLNDPYAYLLVISKKKDTIYYHTKNGQFAPEFIKDNGPLVHVTRKRKDGKVVVTQLEHYKLPLQWW